MHSDDPDRAAILARRRRFIALALAGTGVTPSTGCRPEPCLSPPIPDGEEETEMQWDRDPVITACPAELEPTVSSLIDAQIRLPKGVTPEVTAQHSPHFVRLSRPVDSVSCIEGVPGAALSYFAMTVIQDDASKSMPALRDEFLEAFGYLAPTVFAESIDEATRSYEGVIDQPASPPSEEARAYLYLKANAGVMYAVVYEVHPDAWNAMEASIRASAASLSFSP